VYFKDPENCLPYVLQNPDCSNEYFSHASSGDGNCHCISANTYCPDFLYSFNVVSVYQIHYPTPEPSVATTSQPEPTTPSPTMSSVEDCNVFVDDRDLYVACLKDRIAQLEDRVEVLESNDCISYCDNVYSSIASLTTCTTDVSSQVLPASLATTPPL